MGEQVQRAVETLAKLAYSLGLRRAYMIDVAIAALALALAVSVRLFGLPVIPFAIVAASAAAAPGALRIAMYLAARRAGLSSYPAPRVPIIVALLAFAAAVSLPLTAPLAALTVALVEEPTVLLTEVDIFRVKRAARTVVEPLARREAAVLFAAPAASAAAASLVTSSFYPMLYALGAYLLILYSIIAVPPEARVEERESILDELAKRMPAALILFYRIYYRPGIVRLAREAGLVGASYDILVRRASGFFVATLYAALVLAPAVFVINPLLSLAVFTAPAGTLLLPHLVLLAKRSSRRSSISRNLIIYLTYFASIASVATPFYQALRSLLENKSLAKTFAMEREAEVYIGIYNVEHDEVRALHRYADTIPHDLYRDVVRTTADLLETAGYGSIFRMLITRMREYVSTYVITLETRFNNIVSTVVSVSILGSVAFPMVLLITNPFLVPIFFVVGSALYAIISFSLVSSALPNTPTEYINAKARYKYSAVIAAVVASALTIACHLVGLDTVVPLPALAALNAAVAFHLGLYYASKHDMDVNNLFLDKLNDILELFSSALQRYNDVSKALRELSEHAALPEKLRRVFHRLSNVFAVYAIHAIQYRGPYWQKLFTFLASIAASYGTAPVDLYKTLSGMALDLKKVFSRVRSFGKYISFAVLVSLFLMSIEVYTLYKVYSTTAGAKTVNVLNFRVSIPILEKEEVEMLTTWSYVAFLASAVIMGLGTDYAAGGTIRYCRWTLVFYVTALALSWYSAFIGYTPGG